MKEKRALIFIPFLFFLLQPARSTAQSTKNDPEKKLQELGIRLAEPAAPTANFLKAVRIGKLVYLSGHGPDRPEGGQVTGKLGSDLTIEQGQEAARLVGVSLLSSLKKEIG
ncbi:MAG TPA: RidA family protein, partial [Segetibacter sp.]